MCYATTIAQMAGIRETLNDYLHTFWMLEDRIEFSKTQVKDKCSNLEVYYVIKGIYNMHLLHL